MNQSLRVYKVKTAEIGRKNLEGRNTIWWDDGYDALMDLNTSKILFSKQNTPYTSSQNQVGAPIRPCYALVLAEITLGGWNWLVGAVILLKLSM